MPIAMVKALQHNLKFKLFDQMRFETQSAAGYEKALMRISTQYGPQCYNSEVQAMMALLETFHTITFTDEDVEMSYIT